MIWSLQTRIESLEDSTSDDVEINDDSPIDDVDNLSYSGRSQLLREHDIRDTQELEATLYQESRDEVWASEMEMILADKVQDHSAYIISECRKRLCRIQFSFNSLDRRNSGIESIPTLFDFDYRVSLIPQQDSFDLFAYIFRETNSGL